jgi:hypothetical protein
MVAAADSVRNGTSAIEIVMGLARSQRGLDHRDLVDLAGVTNDVLNACQPDAAQRGMVISTDVGTAPVLGDPQLMQRLPASLIDNAARHNMHGRRDGIHVAGSGSPAMLSIVNTELVTPADLITRLLQLFQRLAPWRQSDDEGTGLGRSIAKAHNATLTRTPDRGGPDIRVGFPRPPSPRAAKSARCNVTGTIPGSPSTLAQCWHGPSRAATDEVRPDRMRHPARGEPSLDIRKPAGPGQEFEQHRDEPGRKQDRWKRRRPWPPPASGQRPDKKGTGDQVGESGQQGASAAQPYSQQPRADRGQQDEYDELAERARPKADVHDPLSRVDDLPRRGAR